MWLAKVARRAGSRAGGGDRVGVADSDQMAVCERPIASRWTIETAPHPIMAAVIIDFPPFGLARNVHAALVRLSGRRAPTTARGCRSRDRCGEHLLLRTSSAAARAATESNSG